MKNQITIRLTAAKQEAVINVNGLSTTLDLSTMTKHERALVVTELFNWCNGGFVGSLEILR